MRIKEIPSSICFFLSQEMSNAYQFPFNFLPVIISKLFFFVALKFMLKYFLNHTVSSSYFLVTSNIHRCCFFLFSFKHQCAYILKHHCSYFLSTMIKLTAAYFPFRIIKSTCYSIGILNPAPS